MLEQTPIQTLKGVGPKLIEKLEKLRLRSVGDLLLHLPLRYQDKTRLTPIDALLVGNEALTEGVIIAQAMTKGGRNSLLVTLRSEAGAVLTLRFFHYHYRQAQSFVRGKSVRVYGEVRSGPNGLEMVHPSYQLLNPNQPTPLEDTLTPIYPVTEGLGQASIIKLISQALEQLNEQPLPELLPAPLCAELQLPNLNQAIRTLHQPSNQDDLMAIRQFRHPAQQRLILEELMAQQIGLQQLRESQARRYAPAFAASQRVNELLASLPFALTGAQERVLQEIQHDLKLDHPMQRLVQGDVGSGKTVVAAIAALQAAEQGYQVAIMAPTEILAEQHLHAFCEWLEPLDIPVSWLNGRMKVAERREALAQIADGRARVVVGTHALFQDAVEFQQLGLVIIDEQHRFGVHQRLALQQKGANITLDIEQSEPQPEPESDSLATVPHQLIMTATPIPRTLAMTAYGDLNLSIIDELPPGRKPIETAVMSNGKRTELMQHLYAKCKDGVQAYWVCPLIEESEALKAQAAEVTAQEFSEMFPDLRIGLVHGRLKGEQKAMVMNAFKAHELDLLVATTVIEVGVNVPNASLMIIENAERLGLAQLHQLRGRVGRGDKQSHCVLLYQAPLSSTGKARMQIMRETNDGFVIAEEDLKIRGPGEILGTRQTGGLEFRIADLNRDAQWVAVARDWSEQLVAQASPLAQALQERWIGDKVHYQHA